MRKRIVGVLSTLVLVGATAGCMVPPPGQGGTPVGVMTLCIYTDDAEEITLVINASGPDGEPLTDDINGAAYVDYPAVVSTRTAQLPNDCESQRPFHAIYLKAAPGTTIHASIRATGERRTTHLTCVYYVNGLIRPQTRSNGRNSIVCRYTGKV